MTRLARWLDRQTRVSEDEPTWTQTLLAFVLFVALMGMAYAYIVVMAPEMA